MPGTRILLVEDDEVLRDLIGRNLLARSYDVSIAIDAESALALLRATTFDLIFLDINLPDQTGWDILRIARNAKALFIPRISMVILRNFLSWSSLPYVSVQAVWQSSILSRIYPNLFPWRHYFVLPPKHRSARKPIRHQLHETLEAYRIHQFTLRRNCMLDALIIFITIVIFVAFALFTEGCERL